MSALDLFASALGAFMLLAIVTMPFFPNAGDSPELIEDITADMQGQLDALMDQLAAQSDEIDALRDQLASQGAELDTTSDALSRAQDELAMCRAQIPDGDILSSIKDQLDACRALLLAFLTFSLPLYAQSDWREYPSMEWGRYSTALPPNYLDPNEFVVGRLMFPQYERGPFGSGYGNWLRGGTAWSVDYPSGDRKFANLLDRLTMLDVRPVEQPVNLDDGDDAFFWPFMISGLVGSWNLTDAQAAKLREHLLKGGFLLCDSFYGEYEWSGFVATLSKVFPDRAIVDLPDDHPVFHLVFDLSDKRQIPTWQYLPIGYRNDGAEPHWRAILDDDGRIMVMIAHNNDIADGWQRADDAGYPQYEANLSIRMGVNFAIYALTH